MKAERGMKMRSYQTMPAVRWSVRGAPGDVAFRTDVLGAFGRVGIGPELVAELVLATTGRLLDECRPPQLVPVLRAALVASRRTRRGTRGSRPA